MSIAGIVSLDLFADKQRNLRFDVNAFADLEDKAKAGIPTLMSEERVGFQSIRLLLWAGLKWEDRKMTPEYAGRLLQEYIEDGGKLEAVMLKLMEGIKASGLIDMEDEEEVDEKKAVSPSIASPTG